METTTEPVEEKSLCDLMHEAFQLSLDVAYSEIAPDGSYFTWRPTGLGNHEDMISGWADGLVHKYYDNRVTGHCSLQAQIDFDIEKFEQGVERDIKIMKKLLEKLGKPIKLDFAEMRRRGYKGSWAGLPSETP